MTKKYQQKVLAFLFSIGTIGLNINYNNDTNDTNIVTNVVEETKFKSNFRLLLDKESYIKFDNEFITLKKYKMRQLQESKRLNKIRIEDEKRRIAKIKKQKVLDLLRKKQKLNQIHYKNRKENNQTFNVSNGSTYKLTFYTPYCQGCSGKTATGYNVNNTVYYQGYRIVAASPNIPFYTKLKITMKNGSVINAIVLDRGGAIIGNKLDVLVSTQQEAVQLGRQIAVVQIID